MLHRHRIRGHPRCGHRLCGLGNVNRPRLRHRPTAANRHQSGSGLFLAARTVNAGRHDRYADPSGQRLIDRRAKQHVGLIIHLLADFADGFVNFEQRQVVATGDVDQQAARARHAGFFQQRIIDRGLGGADGAAFALGLTGAHHRLAHLRHHRFDIGEVKIDQAMHHHQVGDAAHAHVQDLIGHLERLPPGGSVGRHVEQILIGNDDQSIDILLQLGDAFVGGASAARSLEPEGFRHDTNGQDATLLRHAGNNRRGARAGAATHSSGDEHHVGAIKVTIQIVRGFLRRGTPDIGFRPGAKPLRDVRAKLHTAIGLAVRQLLRVGIGDNEIHTLQIEGDHVVDGVGPATAHPDHGNARGEIGVDLRRTVQVQGHMKFLPRMTG